MRQLSTVPVTAVPGARVTLGQGTDTGGSGRDSTALSSSLEEARVSAVRIYREILRDIPSMRENFSIVEDRDYLTRVVRALFERHGEITDPKVIDMLVFKARQEAGEIRNQWKSRTHVIKYVTEFHELEKREALAAKSPADKIKEARLAKWRSEGLVPNDIETWVQYEHWQSDEDEKFVKFAEEQKLFTREQIERNNQNKSQCVMG